MSTTEQRGTPRRGTTPSSSAGAAQAGRPAPGTRTRHRTAWIIVAFLGALLVVVPCAYWTTADAVSESAPYQSPDNGRAHPVSAVAVDAGSARITITTGARDRVTMNGKLTWSRKRPEVERTWEGDTLTVRTRCVGFVDRYVQNCQVELDLAIPAGTRLKVRSGSGEVTLRELSGPVDVESGSGPVKLTGLTGTVRAKAGSGEIRASRLASPNVTSTTGSGAMSIAFSAPPRQVTARAGSGSVTVTVPEGTRYRVGGRSGSGSRTIQDELIDTASDRSLDITTGSGSASIGHPGF
ncbi:DUF4097 family beta strand repeat-containing protein [Streptomyces hundungensis]|uniref:DUF4097 family beta strand repeat-containing protein n=1 Tax=Streptomyces hundungensis TaxID=1077946 RepID=UPI0034076EEB